MAGAAEDGVDRISRHAFEEVPPEEPVPFHVADLRLDGRPPPKVAPEGIAELSGAADEDATSIRIHPVALVPLVHEGGVGDTAREAFHLIELPLQCVAIERIAWAGLDAHAEAFLVGDSQAHLDAELVGAVRLPFPDALHLGGMQAVELVLRLPLLAQDQFRQDQRPLVALEPCIIQLPLHIPEHLAGHGLQAPQHPLRTLELIGFHVSAVLAESPHHQIPVALPKVQILCLCDPEHGRMHLPVQPGICRMLDGLRLHRGIDDHLLEAALRDGPAPLPGFDRETEQFLHARLADPLPPPRHLARMDRELVLKELLATEELPEGVQHPLRHHLLVREAEGVLEEVEPGHQADGDAGAPVVRTIQAAELGFQCLPVDDPGQLEKLLLWIQDHLQAPPDHGRHLRLRL